MTTTTAASRTGTSTLARSAVAGVAGGLAGGVVFGALMQALGMIGMIAALVGGDGLLTAWAVHLVISAGFGLAWGLLVAPRVRGAGAAAGAGAGYGVLLWVVGALLAMPAMMGMPVLQLSAMAWWSLAGHVAYGIVLALVARAVLARAA